MSSLAEHIVRTFCRLQEGVYQRDSDDGGCSKDEVGEELTLWSGQSKSTHSMSSNPYLFIVGIIGRHGSEPMVWLPTI